MDYSTTLQQLFEAEVNRNPHKTALVFGKKHLSYGELNCKANQFAHYLQQLGIQPDMPVVICMERSFEFFIAILGILKAGGAYIPLDYTQPQARLLLILKESQSTIVVTSPSLQTHFKEYSGTVLLLNNETINKQATANPKSMATGAHLAYAIYTSGSTGTPKGVLIEHQSIVNYALWFSKECVRNAQETIDCSSNPAFDFALTLTIVPLVLGLKIVLCDEAVKKDPRRYLAYLQENNITLIKITPSYFKVLYFEAQHRPEALTHLKKIMLGGENLTTKECSDWLNLYPHHILLNEYGPTETTVAVTLYEVTKNNIASCGDIVPIGYLMPHAHYYILDENKKPVAPGESGELYVGGVCVARGYLNNPETTARFFIDNPFTESDKGEKIYKTGDLCRLLPNGALDCMGRIDHQLKIRGFRVELEEIEQCLLSHPAIKNAAVIASDQWGAEKRIVAYYIPQQDDLSEKELKQYSAQFLPHYMIPSFFVAMADFPRTANDKLDRAALPLPIRAATIEDAPKTFLEKKLAQVWSEELGLDRLSLNDHFFELGGHSLAAARVISKISNQFKKELSLQRFYQDPTLRALALMIKQAPKSKTLKKTALKEKNKTFPLSDFQLLLWLADAFEPKAKRLNIFTRKRILGRINPTLLKKAIDALIQRHPVLSYRIAPFSPQHVLQKHHECPIEEYHLSHLPLKDSERMLDQSFIFLQNYHSWPKNKAQILIRIFYLKNNTTELQLSLPHLIADDVCPDILLNDLSSFYQQQSSSQPHHAYQDYIAQEHHYAKQHFKEDNAFWQDYLKETSLYHMPKEHVVSSMQKEGLPYSTYMPIPESILQHFKQYCAYHHISLLNGLCAALALALHESTNYKNTAPVCINRVKSTREDEQYDQAIGCFLRLEPIKLTCSKEDNLQTLAQKIHKEQLHTTPYQNGSSLVKLASLSSFHKAHPLRKYPIQWGLWLYNALTGFKLSKPVLDSTCRLHALKGEEFLININVQNSFIQNTATKNTHYFGMEVQPITEQPVDLLAIDNLLDVCFLRQDDNIPLLVLSANLTPFFREHIATTLLEIMSHVVLYQNKIREKELSK